MSSSSGPRPKKHSISSLLNSPLPEEDSRNRQGSTHIDSRPAPIASAYRLHIAEWTQSDSSAAQPLDPVAVSPYPYRSPPLVALSDSHPSPLDRSASLRYHPSSAVPEQERGLQPQSDDGVRYPPIPQKRGVSDVQAPEDRLSSRRRVNARDKAAEVVPTGPDERSKSRIKATQTMTLNDGAPGTMYTIIPKSDRPHRDEAPCQVTKVAFPAGTTRLVERQVSRCMSADYKKLNETFPHCLSCASRLAYDTCRFQHVRTFLLDADKGKKIVGFYFPDHTGGDAPPPLPRPSNAPLDGRYIRETMKVVARALLSTIREELERISQPGALYMPTRGKGVCDRCQGSILLSSWICILCGRALCPECFAQVELLTVIPPGGSQDQLDERWEVFSLRNPLFLSCFKTNIRHGATDFILVSRVDRALATTATCDMEQLLRHEPSQTAGSEFRPSDVVIPEVSTSDSRSSISSQNGFSPDPPAHTIQCFKASNLTEDAFLPVWTMGTPLLVTELGHRLKMQWSPEYLAEKFNTQKLNAIDCQTLENRWMTATEFFGSFGRYERRERCWKPQNFPPPTVRGTVNDFRYALPELYTDLVQAFPIPGYVCPDAVRNIASHFTFDADQPNLGPIIDVAYANRATAHSKGSVRLHIERADALNVMTFAASDPVDGGEGGATWDIFRAEDNDKIGDFLRAKLKSLQSPDPMHTDQPYLDDAARRDIWQQYGVKSYRVYQKAGDAVFIPAGCAYQVCNRSDCISVTTGFVSPEHIMRCEERAREVTLYNRTHNLKKPVLPLRAMLWAAWLSCCRQ